MGDSDSDNEADTGPRSLLEACFVLRKFPTVNKRDELAREERVDFDSQTSCKTVEKFQQQIQGALSKLNVPQFNSIGTWIEERRDIRQRDSLGCSPASSFAEQLPTALLSVGSVEASSHTAVCEALEAHLRQRERKYHVARLQPAQLAGTLDSSKIAKSLMQQFMHLELETADVDILVAWYNELAGRKQPQQHILVVMVENVEACSPQGLQHAIQLLRERQAELPVVLVLAVGTQPSVLQGLVPLSMLSQLATESFRLATCQQRLEAALDAALTGGGMPFVLGATAAALMRRHVDEQGRTPAAFVRVVQMLCVDHYARQPLACLAAQAATSPSEEVALQEEMQSLPPRSQTHLHTLPSLQKPASRKRPADDEGATSVRLAEALSAVPRLQLLWSVALQFVHLAAQKTGVAHYGGLLDLFAAATQPQFLEVPPRTSGGTIGGAASSKSLFTPGAGSTLLSTIQSQLRKSSEGVLDSLVEEWHNACHLAPEVLEKVKELLTFRNRQLLTSTEQAAAGGESGGGGGGGGQACTPGSRAAGGAATGGRSARGGFSRGAGGSRAQVGPAANSRRSKLLGAGAGAPAGADSFQERTALLLQQVARDHLRYWESRAGHELFCLQARPDFELSMASPLAERVRRDLEAPHVHLHCHCCADSLSASLPDASIAFKTNRPPSTGRAGVTVTEWLREFVRVRPPRGGDLLQLTAGDKDPKGEGVGRGAGGAITGGREALEEGEEKEEEEEEKEEEAREEGLQVVEYGREHYSKPRRRGRPPAKKGRAAGAAVKRRLTEDFDVAGLMSCPNQQARFEQAAAELQLSGLRPPVSKRRLSSLSSH